MQLARAHEYKARHKILESVTEVFAFQRCTSVIIEGDSFCVKIVLYCMLLLNDSDLLEVVWLRLVS